MAEITVIVSVAADTADRYDEIVAACARAGLRVVQRLPSLGVVTGEIEASGIDALKCIPGVEAVELERSILLPPPDSPVQ